VSPANRPPSAKTQARRDELRWRRQQAIVDLAIDLVTAEGHQAHTMQRIAEELECGIASVYRLYPSRDALIAELQHLALDVLHASWLLGLAHLDRTLAERKRLDRPTRALARAVASAWFWVVAEDPHPHEINFTRRLFIDRDIVVPDEQAAKIMPAALRLIDQGHRCLTDAVAAGALDDGNGVERSIRLIAAITGVVQTAKFGRWDARIDCRQFAGSSVVDHFGAWGADRKRLATALEIAEDEAAHGRLAPPVERPPVTR
jgi:AcrR family transcriptional regulator